jgi:hypothetical protein
MFIILILSVSFFSAKDNFTDGIFKHVYLAPHIWAFSPLSYHWGTTMTGASTVL